MATAAPNQTPRERLNRQPAKQRQTTSQQKPLTRALLLQVDAATAAAVPQKKQGNAVGLRFEERPTGPTEMVSQGRDW